MNKPPLISIITVCYNVADELKSTMTSVLKQGYNNIEYIVIDGGSSDGSVGVIESYDKPITDLGGRLKWLSERDTGIYDAMNKGLALTTGDWVIFMNAGDSFASETILTDVFSIARLSDIVFGKSITRYKDLSAIRYADFETKNRHWYNSKMPNHQAIFINKSLYQSHRYDLSYKYSADTVFLRKVFSLARDIDEVDFPISNFELGGKSTYYGSFSTFKAMLHGSIRIHKKVILPTARHSLKYFFQTVLGKNLYLKHYIRRLNKK
jgi:putative colanic acid biosynthesis glycosyltransferase